MPNLNPQTSDLTVARQVMVKINNRIILELEVPFSVGDGSVGASLNDLALLMEDCKVVFAAGRQSHGQQRGGFKTTGVYPFEALHPAALDRALEATTAYIKALSFNLGEVEDERSFEIGEDLPTQYVLISSWGEYGFAAETTFGRLELRVDYPDLGKFDNRTPIDEIKTFLTALHMYCLGSYRSFSQDIQETVEGLRRDNPNAQIGDDDRAVQVGGFSYHSVGGGHNFNRSRFRLIAGEHLMLPGDGDVFAFLQEFLQRLIREVPELSL